MHPVIGKNGLGRGKPGCGLIPSLGFAWVEAKRKGDDKCSPPKKKSGKGSRDLSSPPFFPGIYYKKDSFSFCVWEATVNASAAIMPSSAWPQGTKRGGGGGGFWMVIVGKGVPNPLSLSVYVDDEMGLGRKNGISTTRPRIKGTALP